MDVLPRSVSSVAPLPVPYLVVVVRAQLRHDDDDDGDWLLLSQSRFTVFRRPLVLATAEGLFIATHDVVTE